MAMTGNTMRHGVNDSGKGQASPGFAIVCRGLKNSVISGNSLHIGAVGQLLVDLGGHDDKSIIRDNIGSLAAEAWGEVWCGDPLNPSTVSYTHLTLPTKRIV